MRSVDVRLVDRDWRHELASCYERESSGLKIVCPFIKQDALWRVLGDHLNSDVRLIARFDLKDFSAGVSDVWALMDVLEAGGEVRGVRGLHSKTFIFGETVAVVTSANLTRRGLDYNLEFGCVSEMPPFIDACGAYFDDLWAQCGPSVSQAQLGEWQEAVEQFLASGARPGARDSLPDHGVDAGQLLPAPIRLPDEVP
jgi:phosphatidylserine/phosphatidylglycerophosphate/cardiolipin synthase-like enzyme